MTNPYPDTGWPETFAGGRVFNQYFASDGRPAKGYVAFIMEPESVSGAGWTVTRTVIKRYLDHEGRIDTLIPAGDNPDASPTGWTWRVTEVLENGASYNIEVPVDGEVDLAAARHVSPVSGISIVRGPSGPTGATGPEGPEGPDVYATAVRGGFEGSFQDFLDSVVQGPAGPTGAQGPQGVAGPAGATGATGPAGAIGATGPAGATGSAGPTGAAGPVGAAGATGAAAWTPIYAAFTDDTRRVLQVVDWTGGGGEKPDVGLYLGPGGFTSNLSLATNIRGEAGPTGSTGAAGADIFVHELASPPVSPNEGALWFDTTEGTLNARFGDTWVNVGGPAGPQGLTGATGSAGADATVSELAAPPTGVPDGKLWLDTTTGTLNARIADTWMNVGGPAGADATITPGDTPPESPGQGKLWLDSTTGALNAYLGSAWVGVGGVAGPPGADASVAPLETPPASPGEGELWFDTTFGTLNASFGGTWVNVGGPAGPPGTTRPRRGRVVVASNALPASVKEAADFACDGVNDQAEISEAMRLASHPTDGFGGEGIGGVELIGDFRTSHDGLTAITGYPGVELAGHGMGATILPEWPTNVDRGAIELVTPETSHFIVRGVTIGRPGGAAGAPFNGHGFKFVQSGVGNLYRLKTGNDAFNAIIDCNVLFAARKGLWATGTSGGNRETRIFGGLYWNCFEECLFLDGSSDCQVIGVRANGGAGGFAAFRIGGGNSKVADSKAYYGESPGAGFLIESSRCELADVSAQDNGGWGFDFQGADVLASGVVADSNSRLSTSAGGIRIAGAGVYEAISVYDRGQTPSSPQRKAIEFSGSRQVYLAGRIGIPAGGTYVTGTPAAGSFVRLVQAGSSTPYTVG